MRRSRVIVNLIAILMVVAVAILSFYPLPASASDQYALSNGYFFTQTSNRPGLGFAVQDDGRDNAGQIVRMWDEFQRFGGVAILGYPVSRPYQDADGFIYQLFQRGLLQWRPELNAAVLANVLDQLSSAGADPWLASLGIPKPIADDGSNGNFGVAVNTRLSWLTEPHIRDWYFSNASGDRLQAIARFGLPTSMPARSGPFVVQRFQRVALQLWTDNVSGMPSPGTVVPVLAGDLMRQRAVSQGVGVLDGRFVPEAFPGPQRVVAAAGANGAQVDDGLRAALDALAANPNGGTAAAALRTSGVKVTFDNVGAIALFTPGTLTVAVNPQWRGANPRLLATVLAHEGSHLTDYLNGVDMQSTAGCYGTELNAFQTQAQVWADFYGPAGKPDPSNTLEAEMNSILFHLTNDPNGFRQTLISTYRAECGG